MTIADAAEASVDILVVQLGSILHDSADHKYTKDPVATEQKIRSFLTTQKVVPGKTEKVCKIIDGISFSKQKAKGFLEGAGFIEFDIVQDADRLDAIGAVGVARCFMFGGARGHSLESGVQHFEEKLFLLKDLMKTKVGKTLAVERHQILVQFHGHCKSELGLEPSKL
eukprot:Plantae.Rhodophyta-Hildenbrandia_rubra.ctg16109.p2 GENE.Plantae.Rhodophyta-Hildenbrandia_rubra.ctg16109~~Plantae.Rhodophyta-Hildenbrandia_rubra.ctg16109.p2  ORF type:complete len:186 (+),score=31.45 Plantae.Rhodophyta-Hildenbrandia_rubra.ctg16109:55-558(+)